MGAAGAASGPALTVSLFVPGASRDAARAGQIRTQADRGPPLPAIA